MYPHGKYQSSPFGAARHTKTLILPEHVPSHALCIMRHTWFWKLPNAHFEYSEAILHSIYKSPAPSSPLYRHTSASYYHLPRTLSSYRHSETISHNLTVYSSDLRTRIRLEVCITIHSNQTRSNYPLPVHNQPGHGTAPCIQHGVGIRIRTSVSQHERPAPTLCRPTTVLVIAHDATTIVHASPSIFSNAGT